MNETVRKSTSNYIIDIQRAGCKTSQYCFIVLPPGNENKDVTKDRHFITTKLTCSSKMHQHKQSRNLRLLLPMSHRDSISD